MNLKIIMLHEKSQNRPPHQIIYTMIAFIHNYLKKCKYYTVTADQCLPGDGDGGDNGGGGGGGRMKGVQGA